tara:strand:- start:56 stop:340 length:285 start_codon:yes stop_codon:yes gene_type:complete
MKKHVLKALIALLMVYTIALSLLAAPALAQTDTSDQAATTSAASDPEANLPYLFAVYAVTWVAFFAYLYYLSQRQQNLRREVEELREALAERER